MSSTSTNDTYGSGAFDYSDLNGRAAADGRGGDATLGGEDGGSGGSSSSKAVDDFKDGVEMLTEKRYEYRLDWPRRSFDTAEREFPRGLYEF